MCNCVQYKRFIYITPYLYKSGSHLKAGYDIYIFLFTHQTVITKQGMIIILLHPTHQTLITKQGMIIILLHPTHFAAIIKVDSYTTLYIIFSIGSFVVTWSCTIIDVFPYYLNR